jgi:glycerophosphoryl diester phosphodiesterase
VRGVTVAVPVMLDGSTLGAAALFHHRRGSPRGPGGSSPPAGVLGMFTRRAVRLRRVIGVIPLYAHRLGRAYGPDNSRSALAGALASDADGLECDVCLTADGELVLLHDPWLPVGTDLEGWAHERSAAELRRARLCGGEAPLFLEELLAIAPRDRVLQLEVKAHADPELATRTVEALAAALARGAGRRVEVLSFASAACARAASLGLPARLVIWADYAPRALARWARRHRIVGVCVEHFVLSRPLVAVLRRGGLGVTTGTVNDAALLRRVAALGVDAVTTDDPAGLRARLSVAA